jgi:hypothetical protein
MIEHENSRLIGELIGEMRGVRLEIAHLNNTLAANTEATHDRVSLITTGAYTAIKSIIGVFNGIKL